MKKNNLHDTALASIPIICIFQAYYGITAGLLDLLCLLIMITLTRRFVGKTLVVDKLAMLLLLIVIFAFFTLFVFKITQTSWINVFRSNLFVLVVYLYAINYRDSFNIYILRYPFLAINLFNLWVLFTTWSTGFTHFSTDISYFNLNNIGMISLIVFLSSMIIELRFNEKSGFKLIGMANIILAAGMVMLSFSRANYLMMFISIVFLMFFVFSSKSNLKFIFALLAGLPIIFYQDINSSILSYGFSFLDEKVNVATPTEIFSGRIYDIAIEPLERYIEAKGFLFMFLGGSLLPEHSLLVTHITCFGLFSMIFYVLASINTFKDITSKSSTIKLTALMMLLLFLNDSSTNASTYIAFVKLIPFTMLGLMRGNNDEKHRKFTW